VIAIPGFGIEKFVIPGSYDIPLSELGLQIGRYFLVVLVSQFRLQDRPRCKMADYLL